MSDGANTTCGQPLVECYRRLDERRLTQLASGLPRGRTVRPGRVDCCLCGATPIQACAQRRFCRTSRTSTLDVNPLCFGYFAYTDCTTNVVATSHAGPAAQLVLHRDVRRVQESTSGTTKRPMRTTTTLQPERARSRGRAEHRHDDCHWQLRQNGRTWRTARLRERQRQPVPEPRADDNWGTVHRAFTRRDRPHRPDQGHSRFAPSESAYRPGRERALQRGTDQVTVTFGLDGNG